MPFKSEAQRRYLWMHHPKIAKKWAHEHPESNKGLPMHKKSKVYQKAYHEEKARLAKNRKKSG